MESKKIFSYTVHFDRADEGGYVVTVPMLPGCFSQGETFEVARQNIEDAIIGYLSVLKEDGEQIPVESKEHIIATIGARLPAYRHHTVK
jgi:predicted RNase H-like HicB family nuclease